MHRQQKLKDETGKYKKVKIIKRRKITHTKITNNKKKTPLRSNRFVIQ